MNVIKLKTWEEARKKCEGRDAVVAPLGKGVDGETRCTVYTTKETVADGIAKQYKVESKIVPNTTPPKYYLVIYRPAEIVYEWLEATCTSAD